MNASYERDVVVTRVVSPEPRQALNAVHTLRGSIAALEVPGHVRSEALHTLDEIEEVLRLPDPDRGVVTARLEQLTELLTDTGALARVRGSPIRSIRTIVAWLGPIGAGLFGRRG